MKADQLLTSALKLKLTGKCFTAGGTVTKSKDGAVLKKNPKVDPAFLDQTALLKKKSLKYAKDTSGDPKRLPVA